MLNGQEPFADPFYFDVTGVYGQSFSYDTSPNPYGSTAPLVGYDTYIVGLSLDYALTALTLTDPSTTGVGTRTPAAGDLLVAPNPAGSTVRISAFGARSCSMVRAARRGIFSTMAVTVWSRVSTSCAWTRSRRPGYSVSSW
jgi:hypothetical protein